MALYIFWSFIMICLNLFGIQEARNIYLVKLNFINEEIQKERNSLILLHAYLPEPKTASTMICEVQPELLAVQDKLI